MAQVLILGTRKGTLVLKREGGAFKPMRASHSGIPVPYACVDPRTGTLWATLDHGHWGSKLQRSENGGESWEELTPPAYPEDEELADGTAATLKYLWVLGPGGAGEPKRLYLGTEPGGLFVSDDGGESWELNRGLWEHPSRKQWFGGGRDNPGIHSILVDPRDHRRVLVGISCAGVFETADGGATWKPANRGCTADFLPDPTSEVGQDPHFVAGCASAPDVLWQQNHCGIFRSTDGAKNWTKVSQAGGPAHFGFAVAVDAKNPETAWVVPAQADEVRIAVGGALCVCRSDDGGKSWQAFRKGLPQEQAYDVTFRHALDVSGDALAFGTTTGNVYVSFDRGASWTCLGNNFPPVYSVRFGEL
ncbi:MAG: glycosyl hydrolase [Planctomycetota bacterium]|nr:glycosyl hydrolase [Planctomycetota bacterium]